MKIIKSQTNLIPRRSIVGKNMAKPKLEPTGVIDLNQQLNEVEKSKSNLLEHSSNGNALIEAINTYCEK